MALSETSEAAYREGFEMFMDGRSYSYIYQHLLENYAEQRAMVMDIYLRRTEAENALALGANWMLEGVMLDTVITCLKNMGISEVTLDAVYKRLGAIVPQPVREPELSVTALFGALFLIAGIICMLLPFMEGMPPGLSSVGTLAGMLGSYLMRKGFKNTY